jgi:hypothetical protein
VVDPHVAGHEAVHVAAEEHRVLQLGQIHGRDHAPAVRAIAAPALGVHAPLAVAGQLIKGGDEELLGDDVPARLGIAEAVVQPTLLGKTEHGPVVRFQVGAAQRRDVAAAGVRQRARLLGAILALIRQGDLGQVAEPVAVVDAHLRRRRDRAATDRHVFVEGLIGGAATLFEGFDRVLRIL